LILASLRVAGARGGHGHHRRRKSSAPGASSGGRRERSLNLGRSPPSLRGLVEREKGEIHAAVQALVRGGRVSRILAGQLSHQDVGDH
jgi:hypothetical protein